MERRRHRSDRISGPASSGAGNFNAGNVPATAQTVFSGNDQYQTNVGYPRKPDFEKYGADFSAGNVSRGDERFAPEEKPKDRQAHSVYRQEYSSVPIREEGEREEDGTRSKYVLGILIGVAVLVVLLILCISLGQWLSVDLKNTLSFLQNGIK